MTFAARPPSSTWEAVVLSTAPAVSGWAWFKPPHAPNSVTIHIPDDVRPVAESAGLLTIRRLAMATGLEPLVGWTVAGQFFPHDERTSAYLDVPLPRVPEGVDPHIVLWGPLVAMPMMAPAGIPFGDDPGPLFEMIEYYWSAIQQIESELRRTRMQLEQAMSRLSSLNRDLNTEEALAADSLDKKDWQEARRWLKDCASPLSRSVKEIDIGIVSGAGQRGRFEDLYKQYVVPRIPFAGLKQAAVDFEMHHKSAKNVLTAAQVALSKGSSDGERRAHAVLNRLAGKIRQRRNKARGTNA
jgi:hypothetical protein